MNAVRGTCHHVFHTGDLLQAVEKHLRSCVLRPAESADDPVHPGSAAHTHVLLIIITLLL